MTNTCAYCGSQFIRNCRGRFCSWDCYNKARAKHRQETRLDRFWSYVVKSDGCWLWTGPHTRYGLFHQDGRYRLAHRVMYEITHGELNDGLVIRHMCDNPLCVRPDHLVEGSQAENIADMIERQRGLVGDKHWTRKHQDRLRLTDEQVREIVRRYQAGGITQKALCIEYGVSTALICGILKGKRRQPALLDLADDARDGISLGFL